jgi:hypothetical protein
LLSDLVERLAKMTDDVKLVEEYCSLGCVPLRRVPKWLPHIHDGDIDLLCALFPEKCEELVHALLGAVRSPKPDGSALFEVAHDNSVSVTLLNRDLVHANHAGLGLARAPELLPHITLVELLDRVPIEHVLLGDVLDGLVSAFRTDDVAEALGAKRAIKQPLQSLASHGLALPALDPPEVHLEVDAVVATREIADLARLLIVPAAMGGCARPANCFFERRLSRMTRAQRSPKRPVSSRTGVKPGKRYVS